MALTGRGHDARVRILPERLRGRGRVQRPCSAQVDPVQLAEAENEPPPRSSAWLARALDEVPNQETAPRV